MDSEGLDVSTEVIRVARRVYVGNLPWRTSWQELKDYFSQVGSVRYADVLREGGPGSKSKGCGIVEFETAEEAAAAIQQLNHTEMDGRMIFVREDREDYELKTTSDSGASERPPSKRTRQTNRPGGSVSIGRRVFASNLAFEATWQQVKDHFKQAGHVVHADILEDSEGRSKGCAIVEYGNPSDALRAISVLSNSIMPGTDRQILVREDREDPGARASAHSVPSGCQIVVHGLPYRMAWQDLKDLCKSYGTVVRADIMSNADGTSKGYGVVSFASADQAEAAIAGIQGRVVDGRVLAAKLDRFSS